VEERPDDASVPATVSRLAGGGRSWGRDTLVAEEPLEIRLRSAGGGGEARRHVVTMRTPGHDADLVLGLLFSEGIVSGAADVVALERPGDRRIAEELRRNVAVVTLAAGVAIPEPDRAGPMSSACGVCGRRSIEEVLHAGVRRPRADLSVSPALLSALPERLRAAQSVFAATGGLHAAGLFAHDGTLLVSREDVGRHNAVDKAIGACLAGRTAVPPILLVTGRIGFEIAQKAALSGVTLLAGVSAPTSLAVELAEESGMTLAGFLRGGTFNVYSGSERIA